MREIAVYSMHDHVQYWFIDDTACVRLCRPDAYIASYHVDSTVTAAGV